MNKFLLFFIGLIFFGTANSQTTITTNHTNNNGNGSVTFNVHNSNAYDILITDLQCHLGTTSTNVCELLVNPTPVNDGRGSLGWWHNRKWLEWLGTTRLSNGFFQYG